MTSLMRIAIATVLFAVAGSTSCARVSVGEAHVVVSGLPACAYGAGYERPVRVELVEAGEPVATTYSAGAYMGVPIEVSIYASALASGRYDVRVGLCPSLREDPEGSLACDDVDWIWSRDISVVPRGLDRPKVVYVGALEIPCLPAPNAE